MATPAQVDQLRRMTNYKATDPYDDTQLSALIDEMGSLNRVAERMWNEKAAEAAELVNVSESGSSRSLGDAHKNALAMARYYKALADEVDVETPVDTTRFARTRAAVREG
jgi:hypothetical protein